MPHDRAAPRIDRAPDAGLYGYERALPPGCRRSRGSTSGPGRLCGAPAAAAAILPEGKAGLVPGLADSKLLTAKARERCYEQVLRRALAWSVVVIEPGECDRLGMHVANVEALRRSLARLDLRPAYVLTEGSQWTASRSRAWPCGRATEWPRASRRPR